MTSSPSHSGWHSSVSDGLRHYLSGTPDLSPPIDIIPPGSVLLNWHDFAHSDYLLSHFIPQTSTQTPGPGCTSPYHNQAHVQAPTHDRLSDFRLHKLSNTQSQLAWQSAVLGAPSEPYSMDPPMQTQIQRPHMAQSISKPRRRREAPRSKHQDNRVNKPQTVSGKFKCKWKDCSNIIGFSRKGELQRHVNTIHLSPRSFECPKADCERAFNRKDNLSQHLDRVHETN